LILTLEELKHRNFQLSDVNLFHQTPKYRTIKQISRRVNGFLIILQGCCRYCYQGGDFVLTAGSCVYLPSGSRHEMVVESETISFYRIDFVLTVDGEIARFSDIPVKLSHQISEECAQAVQSLADQYQFVSDTVAKTELMCKIFRSLTQKNSSPINERLSPALRYLMEHLTEKIYCTDLAKLCNLSTPQFYYLFHHEYGMAPLEYRDALLMKRAEILLEAGTFSVKEISDLLGFESVSYFSRFFKKHRGIAPSRFAVSEP